MHLDLLGIPQSRRKMSKRLGGIIIGFKDKTVECCCVFFPLILDIKFVGRTSLGSEETVRSRDQLKVQACCDQLKA